MNLSTFLKEQNCYEQFINNFDETWCKNYNKTWGEDSSDLMVDAFSWSSTCEGYSFWNTIYNKFIDTEEEIKNDMLWLIDEQTTTAKITQKDMVINQIKLNGYVSRNWALSNYISRLGAIICDMQKDGYIFKGKYVKVKTPFGYGKNYIYTPTEETLKALQKL